MYKLGIIGAGSIVESCHLPILKNLGQIEICWIYDRNEIRSAHVGKMFNISNIIKGNQWQDAIDQVDICLLTVPYGARKEYIEVISRKKKCLYVEKPFAITEKEHQNYCNLFPDYALAIGFQRRFYQTVWSLHSIIKSKIFGDLLEIQYTQGHFSLKGGSGYLSDAKLSGGGVIIESAIHALDQINIFTDAQMIKLITSKLLSQNMIEYDSSVEAEIITKKETIKFSSEISTLRNLDNGLKLIFDNAQITCELTPNSKIKVLTDKAGLFLIDNFEENDFAISVNESFYIFWIQYLKALELKTANFTSGITSALTTKFIEDIYEFKK